MRDQGVWCSFTASIHDVCPRAVYKPNPGGRNMRELTRILYAEDDPDIQMITMIILESEGYKVEACNTGLEAMEKVCTFKPELILLDVMMPIMDGATTFLKLQQVEETKNIPVIFLTAKVAKMEVDYYLSIGVKGVIYKPFDPNTLVEQIKVIYEEAA